MAEPSICPICKTKYDPLPEECTHCGYPFAGSDKEKSKFAAQQILKQGEITDEKDRIRQAQLVLFVIAAFNIMLPIIQYTNAKIDTFMLTMYIGVGLFFAIFGLLAKREPFLSILIPFCLLVVSYLVDAIMNPATLPIGIFWKILFVGSLLYCLIKIKKSEKLKKESDYLASRDRK